MEAADLAELAARLSEHADPESVEARFAAAVERWLLGAVDSLDAALDLGGAPGIERAVTRWRRAQRDRHIRTAWRVVAPEARNWTRSIKLAEAASRFETVTWPRWRKSGPPPGASALSLALFQARQYGKLPSSVEQFHNIVKTETDRLC